jgi:hypothetical protein
VSEFSGHSDEQPEINWSEIIEREGEHFAAWFAGFMHGAERRSSMTEAKRDDYLENLDGLLATGNLPGSMRVRCIRAKNALLGWLPGTEWNGCRE